MKVTSEDVGAAIYDLGILTPKEFRELTLPERLDLVRIVRDRLEKNGRKSLEKEASHLRKAWLAELKAGLVPSM